MLGLGAIGEVIGRVNLQGWAGITTAIVLSGFLFDAYKARVVLDGKLDACTFERAVVIEDLRREVARASRWESSARRCSAETLSLRTIALEQKVRDQQEIDKLRTLLENMPEEVRVHAGSYSLKDAINDAKRIR